MAYNNSYGGGGYSSGRGYSNSNNYGNSGGYGQSGQGQSDYGSAGGYGNSGNYNSGSYSQQPQGEYSSQPQGGYGGNNRYNNSNNNTNYDQDVEMQNNPQTGYSDDTSKSTPGDRILDDCTEIDRAVSDLESRHIAFKALTSRILSDRASPSELEAQSAEIMNAYRNVAARMKKIKQNPESGSPRNAPQVGRVNRRLKTSMEEFQRIERDFRASMKEQQTRQYRIVNPAASEDEVRAAVEDPNAQIFQQALMNADRRGQAQTTLNAVRQRHQAIQQIEQTMIELSQLFQDLDNIVMQQDEAVKMIEEKGEEVQTNMVEANKQLTQGIGSARRARKGKWICLGIGCFLILVIIIVILIWFFVIRTQAKAVTNTVNGN